RQRRAVRALFAKTTGLEIGTRFVRENHRLCIKRIQQPGRYQCFVNRHPLSVAFSGSRNSETSRHLWLTAALFQCDTGGAKLLTGGRIWLTSPPPPAPATAANRKCSDVGVDAYAMSSGINWFSI